MYWPYFNRVMTYETDRANVEYNFGSCNHTCPADYVDSAYEIVRGGGVGATHGGLGVTIAGAHSSYSHVSPHNRNHSCGVSNL